MNVWTIGFKAPTGTVIDKISNQAFSHTLKVPRLQEVCMVKP
jgi:hypothetical protein